jgi:peptide/nickel transport system ATP-binding protein
VEDLKIRYHTREGILTAIRNVSFEIAEREIVGIVGESGCGKSTLSSAIMRLLPSNGEIAGGRILFQDHDLRQLDQDAMREIRGKDVAMIFQDAMTSLNPVFSIREQMVDALRAHPVVRQPQSRKRLITRAVDMLDRIGIADASRQIEEFPHQFSGGMRQRISIAMALLSNPSLLIADEPTSALDVTLEAQIIDLIRGLRDEFGTAILYVTHDLGVVAQLCDRVMVMYAGNIVESGDVFNIFEQPKHPYTQALLRSHPSRSMRGARLRTIPGRVPSLLDLPAGCKFAPRCEYAGDVCHAGEPEIARVDGQRVLCFAYHADWAGATPRLSSAADTPKPAGGKATAPREKIVVETRELRTHFRDHIGLLRQMLGQRAGTVRAVDGVDIQIRRGETLALVGESGSGKTTFGRTVLQLERSTEGQVVVEGRDITTLSQSQIRPMRARMQMIFQEPFASLNPRMKVSSLVLEPFQIHGQAVDAKSKLEELLAMVGLSSEQANKYPHQLSGGQARRVGIARALALHPDILVADEPTAGLDVSVAAGILNLLQDLRERLSLTYIVITHNLNVVGLVADRVAVMYLGKIIELAGTRQLFEQPKHPYTEALMSAVAVPDPRLRDSRQRIILEGEIPSPRNPPPGCPFHPRCRYAEARCAGEVPLLRNLAGTDRQVACHFPDRVLTQLACD